MKERERERQRHKQAPCREPDAGLDPRSPGSHPRPKAALNRWATRAALNFSIFFLRFYVFIHEKHTHTEKHRHRQREKQAPCREPDVGLDPGSPGSRPGLKAALNH